MDRKQVVLAALAPAMGGTHTPVQVQKILFLIDREIPKLIGGPVFHFEPYDYGPFDKDVYDELEALRKRGLVEVTEVRYRRYRLTDAGQEAGQKALASLGNAASNYIKNVSGFVRKLSFDQLVSAIYKAYPEMKANSVFKG